MPAFIDLTPELLGLILSYLKPHDVISFGRTCRRAKEYICPNNQILWKAAFLHVFDHPKHVWESLTPTARVANRPREDTWDWHRELRRRCVAFHAVCQYDADPPLNVEDVVTALLDVSEAASYTNVAEGKSPESLSLNVNFLEDLQQRAPNFDRIVHDYHEVAEFLTMDKPPIWASRFHIVYGPTEKEGESMRSKAAARALVYDRSVMRGAAEYGPFCNDATDWQIVEAISSLVHRILNTKLEKYHLRHSGFAINVPRALPLNFSIPEDWAGVTGPWLGSCAFLVRNNLVRDGFDNYREFPWILGDREETCGDPTRLLLFIVDPQEVRQDHRLQTNLPYCKDLPMLFFRGTSTGGPTAPSYEVRGFVCLVPGGREVRWRLIIRYADQDCWRLEGVQPGGVRSGPIYGLWTHVDYQAGPIAPFYYCPLELCQPSGKGRKSFDIFNSNY